MLDGRIPASVQTFVSAIIQGAIILFVPCYTTPYFSLMLLPILAGYYSILACSLFLFQFPGTFLIMNIITNAVFCLHFSIMNKSRKFPLPPIACAPLLLTPLMYIRLSVSCLGAGSDGNYNALSDILVVSQV